MRWFWLGLFCLVVAFMGFLPTILSTEVGKTALLSWINHGIRGSIEVEKLHLSWRGPQEAKNLQLNDTEGTKIATVESLLTSTSLYTLIFHRNTFGATTVVRPALLLERDQSGSSNIGKSLTMKPQKGVKRGKWPTLTGKLTVEDGKIEVKAPYLQDITISNTNLEYFPDKKLFHLRANTQEGEISGEILASGSLGEKRHILAQIDNFPVAVLDQLGNSELYTKMIGEKINLKIESTDEQLSATVQSKLLNGKISGQLEDDSFSLNPKSSLSFIVTPTFFNELISEDLRKEWTLGERTTLVFDITDGEIPSNFNLQKSKIEARVSLGRAELLHAKQGHFSLNNFEGAYTRKDAQTELKIAGEITGKESSKLQANMLMNGDALSFSVASNGFPFSLLELGFDEASALQYFFGDSVDIALRGTYSPTKGLETFVDLSSFSTSLHGEVKGQQPDDLSLHLDGTRRLTGGLKDAIGEGTTFSFGGKAAWVRRILSVSTFSGRIDNDVIATEVKGILGKKGERFTFDQVKIEGNGKLLNLPINKHYEGAKLKEGSFSFVLDGSKNSLIAKTRTSFEAEGDKEVIGELKIKDFIVENKLDYKNAQIDFSGNLEHFPTGVLDIFTPKYMELSELIGPTLNLKGKFSYNPKSESRLKVDLVADSPGFLAELALSVDPTFQVTQSRPGKIRWELSHKRYEALMAMLSKGEQMTYELQTRSVLNIDIEKIYCPTEFPDTVRSFVCRSGVVGRVHVEPLLFVNPDTQDRFTLQHIEGSLFGENFSRKIHMELSGEVYSPKLLKREQGQFQAEMDLLNLWNDDPLALSGEIDLSQIPVKQIVGIVPLDPIFRKKTEALLGENLDANFKTQISRGEGPINVDIQASNFKAFVPLQLAQDKILLHDVMKAEITLTDAVSEHFIRDINPMIVKGARSDHPLRVYIDPEGFSFPIPWSFQDLVIENAVVDVGHIFVKNGGATEELMKFLKAKPPKDKMMRAWFTPVFLSLKSGVLRHERFDILLHKNVHIALWGRVDLIKQKVWMTLGIAPQTLKQRFNILGINKKDMFQVKMRGKTDKVELDWSSAYTRIGILVARLAGGPPGYIVGGILEQVISALGEEPTPPPTVDPFPWEVKQQKTKEGAPEKKSPKVSAQQKGSRKLMEFLIP